MELTDDDRAELARLIANGATSGRLDSEEEDENGNKTSVFISWKLTTEKWQEN